MALRDLKVPFEHWKTSDWDVNSVKSYKAIHMSDDNTDYSVGKSKKELIDLLYETSISSDGKKPMEKKSIARKGEKWLRETHNNFKATHNVGSILNVHAEDLEIVDQDTYEYILTYSWPCWSISNAGKQEGMKKGSGTGSSLLWEIQRILEECKEKNCLPNILVSENVSACHNKKNINEFEEWLAFLDSCGYTSVWADLNAKDYGVAQNRLRNHIVSILGDYTYTFPEPIPLKKRLKDYLEDKVDEKYYIKSEKAEKLIGSLIDRGVLPFDNNENDTHTHTHTHTD